MDVHSWYGRVNAESLVRALNSEFRISAPTRRQSLESLDESRHPTLETQRLFTWTLPQSKKGPQPRHNLALARPRRRPPAASAPATRAPDRRGIRLGPDSAAAAASQAPCPARCGRCSRALQTGAGPVQTTGAEDGAVRRRDGVRLRRQPARLAGRWVPRPRPGGGADGRRDGDEPGDGPDEHGEHGPNHGHGGRRRPRHVRRWDGRRLDGQRLYGDVRTAGRHGHDGPGHGTGRPDGPEP